jgi:hypothetical protein
VVKKKSAINNTYNFTKYQVVIFALAFGLLGALSAWSAFAQSNNGNGRAVAGTCNIPAETKLGSYYTGTITNLPQSSVINMYVTYGDGTQKVRPFQWSNSIDLRYYDMGFWDGSGNKATILGPTQIKLTGPSKQNEKTTQVLAVCSTTIVN